MKACLLTLLMLILTVPAIAQTIPANKNPAPAKVATTETPNSRVTKVYASHVLTGLCAQDYMTRFEDFKWSAADKAGAWKFYQTGCKCMATEILSVANAADVVDFARATYAEQPTGKTAKPRTPANTNANTKTLTAISTLYTAPVLLKKCGLPE